MSTLTNIQILRSAVPHKRPDPTQLLDGQLAINYKDTDPGLYTLLQNGELVKFGPTSITSDGTHPNQNPSADGHPGNSKGESWLDGRGSYYSPILKIYDGTQWVTANGFTVDANGDFTLLKKLTVNELYADYVYVDNQLDLNGDFLPAGTNCVHSVGSLSNRWRGIFSCLMNTTGDLTVGGDSDLTGFLQVGGYLTVDGNADFRGNVSFTQNCASGDNFQCGMPAAFDCDTTITGHLTGTSAEFSSNLVARGDVRIGDGCGKTLVVNAATTFKCGVDFQSYPLTIESAEIGELVVTGNTTLGNSCANDTLNIESKTFLKCNTKAQSEFETQADFVSSGPAYFKQLIKGEDIELNKKGTSKSTVSSDPGETLCTKDYMEFYVENYTTEWTQSGVTVHTTVPNLHVNPNYGTGTIGTLLDSWREAHIQNIYPDASGTGILGTQGLPWLTSYVRNYEGDTLALNQKGTSAQTVDGDPGNTLVTKDYLLNKIPPVGDGQIRINAGNGITATGDNATANQFNDTTRTITVKIKDNTLSADTAGLFVNKQNLGIPAPANNGAINFNAGNGLTSSGSNATADQINATTKTFTVQNSNSTITVGGSGISVNTSVVDTVGRISCVQTGGNNSDPSIRSTRTGRDAGSEEVQITGGTNISVTRDSGNKLTIASTAPAPATVYWQESGGHIRPTTSNRNVIPNGGSADLGLTGTRWRNGYFNNVYTNDLHLKNERGDWTLIEEEDCLTMRNNKTGKRYAISMTPYQG